MNIDGADANPKARTTAASQEDSKMTFDVYNPGVILSASTRESNLSW